VAHEFAIHHIYAGAALFGREVAAVSKGILWKRRQRSQSRQSSTQMVVYDDHAIMFTTELVKGGRARIAAHDVGVAGLCIDGSSLGSRAACMES